MFLYLFAAVRCVNDIVKSRAVIKGDKHKIPKKFQALV